MLFFTVLTGLVYPGVITAVCQTFFHYQANGSLIRVHGQIIGSSLIGQEFTRARYFHPRPSACDYDASASGASNDGPTNAKLVARIKASIAEFRRDNPDYTGPIPADLVTASASGLDPDISVASAEAQGARVASARGISVNEVRALIRENTQGRVLGFLGEPRVNVLALNLALDSRRR
jgi:K+-transporting ATPase ATPase C chain